MKLYTSIIILLQLSMSSTIQALPNVGRDLDSINDLLFEKAMPLDEFERKHIASGGKAFRRILRIDNEKETQPEFMTVATKERRTSWWSSNNDDTSKSYYANSNNGDDTGDDTGDDAAATDDASAADDAAVDDGEEEYYSDAFEDDYFDRSNSYSFNSYSLKFATCQKVQRFSIDAVQRGEYSSMVTDDIVVLRLCPSRSCSTKAQYGCSSGYGEYALTASQYMTIIMKYEFAKKERFCSFCSDCGSSYNKYNSNTCYTYSNQCQNTCTNNNYYNNNDDDDGSIDNYLKYTSCEKMQYNGNYYWVKPNCDTDGKVGMGIYYDNYCEQYAGDEIDVSNYLSSDFNSDLFSAAQAIDCIECSESEYGPYYNAHNQLCNNIYKNGGKCDSWLAFDLGKNSYDDDNYGDDYYASQNLEKARCSYIESIRYGTYDASGEIYVSSSQTSSSPASVTVGQRVLLTMVSMVCLSLAIYSCYLHHAMTNLLLKAVSSGLIKRRRPTSATRYASSKKKKGSGGGKKSEDVESSNDKSSYSLEETFSDDYTADSAYTSSSNDSSTVGTYA